MYKIFLLLLMGFSTLIAQKQALIVGIPSHFKPSGIQIDMANMKDLLEKEGFSVTTLSDATTSSIRRALKGYQSLDSKDSFVFYYTGHGGQIKDINGDEDDGKDEVLLLADYDPKTGKGLLLDDEMYSLLNQIPAKRFVFFDSCHSGTAFKSAIKGEVKSKGFLKGARIDEIVEPTADEKRSIFFFGASQDDQQSIATASGSVFTLALIDGLKHKKADSNGDGKITFNELLAFTTQNIETQLSPNPPFVPMMHGTPELLRQDIFQALSDNSTFENAIDTLISSGDANSIEVKHKSRYLDGDAIKLKFDIGKSAKYLSVIMVDRDEITLLYPNRLKSKEEKRDGILNFPSDLSSRFQVTATTPYGRTVLYVILSQEPLNLYDKDSNKMFSVEKITNQDSPMARSVKIESTLSIGKAIFDVRGD